MSPMLPERVPGSIAAYSCFMALKCVEPVNTNMIATAIRPASLQAESRLTPSDPTPRKRMNEITRMNKGAMSISSLPRCLRLHARSFLTQQLQHNPLWGWGTHSNELFIENSFGELRRTEDLHLARAWVATMFQNPSFSVQQR